MTQKLESLAVLLIGRVYPALHCVLKFALLGSVAVTLTVLPASEAFAQRALRGQTGNASSRWSTANTSSCKQERQKCSSAVYSSGKLIFDFDQFVIAR
jgi:hypothetical protein